MTVADAPRTVSLESRSPEPGSLVLELAGHLSTMTAGTIWRRAIEEADRGAERQLIVEAKDLTYCDGGGIGLLLELRRRQLRRKAGFSIRNLKAEHQRLFDLYEPEDFVEAHEEHIYVPSIPEELGENVAETLADARKSLGFIGELSAGIGWAVRRPGHVRWRDVLIIAERAGVNALPVVVLVGFLMGFIMAYQAAGPMSEFGTEVFVADLIAISMLRELGPVMTAIVLAGRTGSAFAAEIGTMKVNEEIDALSTMGLDPVRFLVVPRVIAVIFVTPLLTLFAHVAGLFGGGLVMGTYGYSFVTYTSRVIGAVDLSDLASGLVKSLIFAVLVAGIGCLRGLQTGTGASAVGISTTRAVVSGIILVAVADGVFSIVLGTIGL